MTFDIEKQPPTQAEIDDEIGRIEVEKSRLYDQRRVMIYVWVVLNIVWVVASVVGGMSLNMFVIYFLLGNLTFYSFTEQWDTVARDRNIEICPLCPISGVECTEVVALCRGNKAVANYQNAVANQGRPLVGGEYEAMRAYVASCQAREAQEALKGPVPFARQSP